MKKKKLTPSINWYDPDCDEEEEEEGREEVLPRA